MSHKRSNIPLIAVLEEHELGVWSVVFHPTAHLMATAGGDNNVKLWDTDSHQCLATLVGHTARVSCVAFHPTAPVLISGSADNTLKVWDTTTHQCLSTTPLPVNRSLFKGVSCIAIHPIMSFIVTGEDGMEPPKLWKLSPDNTKLDFVCNIKSMHLDSASTRCVAVHPTEPLFATGRERTRYDSSSLLWSYEETKQGVQTTLEKEIENGRENHSKNVVSIALHPTKPFIATGSNDNTIRLWKLDFNKNGKIGRSECMAILDDHDAAVTGLAFHPTAPVLLSCSADTSVKMWKLPDNREPVQCMGTLLGQRGPVTSIAIHSNGRLLATGNQGNAALLWDCSVLTGKKQREMALMRSGITTNLLDNFFGRRTPQTQGFLDYKSNQRGPNLLTPQEMAASLIARRINSRRRRSAIVAPIRTISPIVAAAPPRDRSRRARSASPPRGKSPSYTRSRRAKSASPSHARRGGSSMIHRIKNHSSRKIKRHASKTKRYRSK